MSLAAAVLIAATPFSQLPFRESKPIDPIIRESFFYAHYETCLKWAKTLDWDGGEAPLVECMISLGWEPARKPVIYPTQLELKAKLGKGLWRFGR